LSGNTQPASLVIQPLDHPRREIDIDALLRLAGTPGFGKVQSRCDALASVKVTIKFLSFHTELPHQGETAARR